MLSSGFKISEQYSSGVYFVEDEYRSMLDSIQNKPIFDESELLALINGDDAVTITAEVYQQLVKMFESSDQDNHIMAMEIMANSNYVDSALYLLLLLEGFEHKISSCNTRNHVNFKSMVSYFNMAVKEIGNLDPDRVASKLIDLSLLTRDWTHILLQERIDWFIRNIYWSKTFNVREFVPTPAVETAINEPYSGIVEYDENNQAITVTELNVLPEKEIESEEKEMLPDPPAVIELNIEPETVESVVETEPELVSNNHQIETNESTDIDWF